MVGKMFVTRVKTIDRNINVDAACIFGWVVVQVTRYAVETTLVGRCTEVVNRKTYIGVVWV